LSQQVVYKILEDLGGRANASDIAKIAKEKYPNYSLYQYVGFTLKKLKKWGYVGKDRNGYWIIKKKYPFAKPTSKS